MAIEAKTTLDMAAQQILPAVLGYSQTLTDAVISKKSIGAACKAECGLITKLSAGTDALYEHCEKLRNDLGTIPGSAEDAAVYYHDVILADMEAIRTEADALEKITDKSCWPFPTYSDLLFY